MVKVKAKEATKEVLDALCFNHPMVKVKVTAVPMTLTVLLSCFNHPMVKVKADKMGTREA